jgi:hypothetical protein
MNVDKTLYELLEGTTDRKLFQLCAAIEELATISNETISNLNRRLGSVESDLDFANQRLDELQSQVEALEER